jgi:hypothetical protein
MFQNKTSQRWEVVINIWFFVIVVESLSLLSLSKSQEEEIFFVF